MKVIAQRLTLGLAALLMAPTADWRAKTSQINTPSPNSTPNR